MRRELWNKFLRVERGKAGHSQRTIEFQKVELLGAEKMPLQSWSRSSKREDGSGGALITNEATKRLEGRI
jgi:hypothetical protein